MQTSRRALLAALPMAWLSSGLLPAAADTATYQYDALGRLVRVTFTNGWFVSYEYDAAGNRREVIRSDNSTFTATLQITGTGPVNLRSVANANGYTGAQNVNITFQVGSAVIITGTGGPGDGGVAIDTGTWSSSVLNIALALQVSGKVRGGGGAGGVGAGTSVGLQGGKGGDAIYCRENINITVNSGGEVRGGGGGGGGGQAWYRVSNFGESFFYAAGGGGGGYPNGPGGPEGTADVDTSNPGAAGTPSGGGAGGTGGGSWPTNTRINGAGGPGGGAAQAGSIGGNVSGTSTGPPGWTWESNNSGQGGAPGYAIRKNGKTVSVTNNGTISGTVG